MTSLISLQKISKTFFQDRKGSRYSTFSISRLVLANPLRSSDKAEVKNRPFCPSWLGLIIRIRIGHHQRSGLVRSQAGRTQSFRAQNLGIVFQQYHLMNNLTTLENVTLPLNCKKPKTMRHPPPRSPESSRPLPPIDSFPNPTLGRRMPTRGPLPGPSSAVPPLFWPTNHPGTWMTKPVGKSWICSSGSVKKGNRL